MGRWVGSAMRLPFTRSMYFSAGGGRTWCLKATGGATEPPILVTTTLKPSSWPDMHQAHMLLACSLSTFLTTCCRKLSVQHKHWPQVRNQVQKARKLASNIQLIRHTVSKNLNKVLTVIADLSLLVIAAIRPMATTP